jgi:hypothetical protein
VGTLPLQRAQLWLTMFKNQGTLGVPSIESAAVVDFPEADLWPPRSRRIDVGEIPLPLGGPYLANLVEPPLVCGNSMPSEIIYCDDPHRAR